LLARAGHYAKAPRPPLEHRHGDLGLGVRLDNHLLQALLQIDHLRN